MWAEQYWAKPNTLGGYRPTGPCLKGPAAASSSARLEASVRPALHTRAEGERADAERRCRVVWWSSLRPKQPIFGLFLGHGDSKEGQRRWWRTTGAEEHCGSGSTMLRPNWAAHEHQWMKRNSGEVVAWFGMHRGELST